MVLINRVAANAAFVIGLLPHPRLLSIINRIIIIISTRMRRSISNRRANGLRTLWLVSSSTCSCSCCRHEDDGDDFSELVSVPTFNGWTNSLIRCCCCCHYSSGDNLHSEVCIFPSVRPSTSREKKTKAPSVLFHIFTYSTPDGRHHIRCLPHLDKCANTPRSNKLLLTKQTDESMMFAKHGVRMTSILAGDHLTSG